MNIPQPYTKYRSITDTIRLWRVIRDSVFTNDRRAKYLAIDILGKDFEYIKNMAHQCPLCCNRIMNAKTCTGYCPLQSCSKDSPYDKWCVANDIIESKKYAGMIVDKLEHYLTHVMKKKMV